MLNTNQGKAQTIVDIHSDMQRSFADVVRKGNTVPWPLRLTPLEVEGGNVIVEVDEEEVEKESLFYQFDVKWGIIYQKGDKPFTSMELKGKLAALWKIQNVELAHLGKGFYHVFLRRVEYKSTTLSTGTLN